MAARHSIRTRRLVASRGKVAQDLHAPVLSALQVGWRRLYGNLRRLDRERVRKDDWLDAWYFQWQAEFSADMEQAMQAAIQEVVSEEQGFWTAAVSAVMLDPQAIVRDYIIQRAHLITGITSDTKQMVRDAIRDWYADPDNTLTSLVDDLSPTFGEGRAWLIANNETTVLISGVTYESMTQLGLLHWSWQSRLEYNVCKRDLIGPDGNTYGGCRELHGKVFTVNDKMPPDGSHIGCMCVPAPIVEDVSKLWPGYGLEKYDDDQPGDEQGRWTDGGGAFEAKPFSSAKAGTYYSAWGSRLNAEELDVLKGYKLGGGFVHVNQLLRTGNLSSGFSREVISGRVDEIDHALAKAPPLPQDTMVYRNMDLDPSLGDAPKVGDEFLDKGFSSTSLSRSYAKQFESDGDRWLVHIQMPKGATLGAYLEHLIPLGEQEFLIKRNTRFRVISVDQGKRSITVRAVGTGIHKRSQQRAARFTWQADDLVQHVVRDTDIKGAGSDRRFSWASGDIMWL